jgi:tRNA pseudouridine13 synthase
VELEALREAGLSPEAIINSPRSPEGGRRPLRVPLQNPSIEGGSDEHGQYIRVAFDLPRGSYATIVLREIMKNDQAESEAVQE